METIKHEAGAAMPAVVGDVKSGADKASGDNTVNFAQARARLTNEQVRAQTKDRLEKLFAKRQQWEQTECARSNAALYGFIGESLAFYRELIASTDSAMVKKEGFRDYLDAKGWSFKSSTELTYKVIRAVFGDHDRRRISTYHTVLRVAVKQNWPVEEVPARIAEYGGVQEISLGSASGQMTAKSKAQVAESAVMGETLATLKSDALSKTVNPERNGDKAVAVMTQRDDGSFTVHAVVHNDTAVTAALAAYYAANKAALKDTAIKQQVVDAQTQRADAIDTAAKSVVNG